MHQIGFPILAGVLLEKYYVNRQKNQLKEIKTYRAKYSDLLFQTE